MVKENDADVVTCIEARTGAVEDRGFHHAPNVEARGVSSSEEVSNRAHLPRMPIRCGEECAAHRNCPCERRRLAWKRATPPGLIAVLADASDVRANQLSSNPRVRHRRGSRRAGFALDRIRAAVHGAASPHGFRRLVSPEKEMVPI